MPAQFSTVMMSVLHACVHPVTVWMHCSFAPCMDSEMSQTDCCWIHSDIVCHCMTRAGKAYHVRTLCTFKNFFAWHRCSAGFRCERLAVTDESCPSHPKTCMYRSVCVACIALHSSTMPTAPQACQPMNSWYTNSWTWIIFDGRTDGILAM